MKLVFILSSLLFTQMSFAASIQFPKEGIYNAKSIDVLLAIRHIIVPVPLSNYDQRIEELEEDGYTCGYTSLQATKCTKQERTAVVPDNIKDRVREKWFGYPLEINEMRTDPVQTFSSEVYQEWEISQGVNFKGKSFTHYRLLVSEKLKKMALGQTYAGAELYFNYSNNSRHFESIIQETQTLSRFEFVSFLIAVKFK